MTIVGRGDTGPIHPGSTVRRRCDRCLYLCPADRFAVLVENLAVNAGGAFQLNGRFLRRRLHAGNPALVVQSSHRKHHHVDWIIRRINKLAVVVRQDATTPSRLIRRRINEGICHDPLPCDRLSVDIDHFACEGNWLAWLLLA